MTYSPGGHGYPPGQQPTTQFAVPSQRYSKVPEPAPAAPESAGKLPVYLSAAVAVLGLAVYLSEFGPVFTISNSDFPQMGTASGTSLGVGLAVLASILAGALAAVSLLPKQKGYLGVVAAISTVAFLLVIAEVINKPGGVSIGWALYLVIAFTLLQAGAAIAAVLFDTGVLTAPEPRASYEQQQPQQYGQYPGPGSYYGQPPLGSGPGHQPPPQHQAPQHQGPPQRPGYPSQYGGGYPSGPSTGGFSSSGSQSGPPTPPTGFPAFGQPQQSSSSAPTTQVPAQPPSSSSSPQQSGPSSS